MLDPSEFEHFIIIEEEEEKADAAKQSRNFPPFHVPDSVSELEPCIQYCIRTEKKVSCCPRIVVEIFSRRAFARILTLICTDSSHLLRNRPTCESDCRKRLGVTAEPKEPPQQRRNKKTSSSEGICPLVTPGKTGKQRPGG